MASVGISITLNEETLEKLDSYRGLISRSAIIGDFINKKMKRGDLLK
jgi:metal-responsive CopG/Arc/MetJ family transcriptional regulator